MTTTIILLLIGFGAGLYWKGRDVRAQMAATARYIDGLNRQIETLRRENDRMRNAESRRQNEAARRKRYFEENDVSDTENQIRFISQADLRAVRPVNKEAVRVLYALDEWLQNNQPEWRMSFEVSMGAFIRTAYNPQDSAQKAAFNSYNSKRVDFLLINRFGLPVLAVEYHGTGHELSDDASDRMEVKRLVLQRAAVPLVEIPAKATRSDILRLISEGLAPSAEPVSLA